MSAGAKVLFNFPVSIGTAMEKPLLSLYSALDLAAFCRARDLELPVNSDMPENIMRLMQLYPQPVRRQPSVEYVPLPYRSTRRAAPEQ